MRRREGEGEGERERDEKEQKGDQIGSCVSFRAAGSHRNLSVGYVAYLVCQPISLSGPSKLASCAPGIRPMASPDPSLDRNRSLIHPSPGESPGIWPISIAARSHDRFRLLGCKLPIGSLPW